MYIRIIEKHQRTCPECNELCLKIPDPYDGEYLPDEEESGICRDCLEMMAAAVPGEWYDELVRRVKNSEAAAPTLDDLGPRGVQGKLF